jgi:predicted AlkP superfamily phosphohydrolase/phosphomutase
MFSLGLTPETAFKMVKKIPLARLRPSRGVSSQPGASKLLSTAFLSFNDVDWSRTQAFSKGNYGQIYVNLKGREPNGAVEESDYETVCDRIVEGLRALKDPENGGPWVGTIYRREEIYSGPRVADAPDIALLPADMRYLPLGNADFTSNKFMVDAFGISGCHRMYGVLIARGGPVKRGYNLKNASIYDVAPTILYLFGREVPDDMDGRVLTEMIEGDFLGANSVRLTAAAGAMKSAEVEFSAEDNADVIERLKSLGYLG